MICLKSSVTSLNQINVNPTWKVLTIRHFWAARILPPLTIFLFSQAICIQGLMQNSENIWLWLNALILDKLLNIDLNQHDYVI